MQADRIAQSAHVPQCPADKADGPKNHGPQPDKTRQQAYARDEAQRSKIGKYCPILHYMAENGGHDKTGNTLDPQRTTNRRAGTPMITPPQPHQHQEERQPSGH